MLFLLLSTACGWLSDTVMAHENPATPVQVLLPGFEVFELPPRLPNLNNVRYRPDGQLFALGYNGNVWLLRDADGDGLEDTSEVFFENKSQLRGPIGMAVIPAGHALLQRGGKPIPTAGGVIVASKGKVSALIDFDGDNVAETERIIASGWQEIPPNVDTIGIAVHPEDGSIYFGLGTAAYNNAYLLDETGQSAFDLASERGTVQRIKPDLSGRETVCTGVRFTIGMDFDRHHELFVTDQEGATWLPNGNPFDELLHIRHGRHYGFPPRHPRHLPQVFDEPSLFDYRPQHQSTCGMVLNLARPPFTKTFGPEEWEGDAFVTGESRGKLYRTRLVRTRDGNYVADTEIFAALAMLAVDCTLTPNGDLLVCCHSGGPDWGTGPGGEGKLFLIRQRKSNVPRPIAAWASGRQELRIAFDRPLEPETLKGLAAKVEIKRGPYVAAGDRFEVLRPGYEVVKRQLAAPRESLAVYSASVTADRRTLVLATGPQIASVTYAVRLPGLGREHEQVSARALPQEPAIDIAYTLGGIHVSWEPDMASLPEGEEPVTWNGVIPHLDLDISRNLRAGVPETDMLIDRLSQAGMLTLSTRLDMKGLYLPVTQPGSRLDFSSEEDHWLTARLIRIRCSQPFRARFQEQWLDSTPSAAGHQVELDVAALETELPLVEAVVPTGDPALRLQADWLARFADGTERSGPLPLHRMLAPWAERNLSMEVQPATRDLPELAGANWGRGRKVFHGTEAACARCHVAHGEGGTIGPDLSNLLHRDYETVLRDIRHPSFAVNPDYITYHVVTKSGQVVTGALRNDGNRIQVGDTRGNTTILRRDEIEELRPSTASIMPEGIADKLQDESLRDLLAYLLLPPPRMPRDAEMAPPIRRSRADVNAMLAGAPEPSAEPRDLRLLLIAGPKDHGPGEHDYPAWLRAWSQLLSAADGVTVDTAMTWPTAEQMESADTVVIYQQGDWTDERSAAIDAHLAKGGGLVLIHWAVEGGGRAAAFAERIGLASNRQRTKYRHGPLHIDWSPGKDHPIARNIDNLSLHDESYWNLVGDPARLNLLARGGVEAGKVRPPLFWTVERGRGRVFVSIPGHYSWTFDDPLYRVILFRGIAWASHEPVDRFNALVPLGVEFETAGDPRQR